MRKSLYKESQRIIESVVRNQKNFNYRYYLSKNCSLGSDWKEKKQKMIEDAKEPEKRGGIFKELFEMNTEYKKVAQFLSEVVM